MTQLHTEAEWRKIITSPATDVRWVSRYPKKPQLKYTKAGCVFALINPTGALMDSVCKGMSESAKRSLEREYEKLA